MTLNRIGLVAMVWLGAAGMASRSPGDVLTMDGLGPVRIGMTLAEAEKALGAKLAVDKDQDPSGQCVHAYRADGRAPEIGYLALDGRIEVVQVYKAGAALQTERGVRIGDSLAQLRRAYGKALVQKPDPDDRFIVDSPGRRKGVAFVVSDGRVQWFEAGRYPALSYYEDCL